eukprot:GHVS01010125.1.p1 GENE.GHVS01010125.1~~GHVS01010125.1.p1  ORF type:complete len:133 (+),score=33.46 GHVS01010125.1:134-532(+)
MEFTNTQQQEGSNEVIPIANQQDATESTPQAFAAVGGASMEYYSPESSTPLNNGAAQMAYPQAYQQGPPMYMQQQLSSYPSGPSYMAQPMTVPQFVAPRYTQYQLPGGAPVTYLPPVMKKADGKKKKKGFCC